MAVGDGAITFNVGCCAHAGDDRGYRCRVQAEAQRELGECGCFRAEQGLEPFRSFEDLLPPLPLEIVVPEVALRESGVPRDGSEKPSLVKRNADDDADFPIQAGAKEIFPGVWSNTL